MKYVTAGESHGPILTAIVSGVPAGLNISPEQINVDLQRRQEGYGRGPRQQIEHDVVEITSGVRFGRTIGSPVTLSIINRDFASWAPVMAPFGGSPSQVKREVCPRPGHADLVGALKMNTDDCRDIMERASARETAIRVAASGIAREFLAELDVEVTSYVNRIGSVVLPEKDFTESAPRYTPLDIEMSAVRCPDSEVSSAMIAEIDAAREEGETLGGTFRVVVNGLLPGIGTYAEPYRRLTAELGAALFSIPAVKGVEFGLGFAGAAVRGSEVHDPIKLDTKKAAFSRASNHAGGLEGGMTTGLPLIITVAMKPISTLGNPLATVNLDTLRPDEASTERHDVCAVPACAVVAESEVAFVLANAYLEKFGGDTMGDIKAAVKSYKTRLKSAAR